jgi:hypothetical protein
MYHEGNSLVILLIVLGHVLAGFLYFIHISLVHSFSRCQEYGATAFLRPAEVRRAAGWWKDQEGRGGPYQLFEIPTADLHVALIIVETLGEALCIGLA